MDLAPLLSGQPLEPDRWQAMMDYRTGRPVGRLGLVTAPRLGVLAGQTEVGFSLPRERAYAIARRAAERYLEWEVEPYLEALCGTSGLPHALGRQNMAKIHHILTALPEIVDGLSRGLPTPACYPRTRSLTVLLPSNSPGVNGLWQPCLPLEMPVLLKPGRLDPWTPRRIVSCLLEAGAPPEAFSFLPTDHEGTRLLLERHAVLFGHSRTTAPYRGLTHVQAHGTGHSKILLGPDLADDWERYLELMADSVLSNSGRSCINTSTILVPRHARAVAEALARRFLEVEPRAPEDPLACLGAFPEPELADAIEQELEGAEDVTAALRGGPRRVRAFGGTYLLPTVVLSRPGEPLADTELHFPFCSVVEVEPHELEAALGRPLVVTAVTRDQALIERLLRLRIPRLNLGAVPTQKVAWDQPHDGNLFDFLFQRRALQQAPC